MAEGTFYVLLSRPDQLQPETIAKTLAAHRKIPLFDARRLAKRGWGFLGERLEEADARLLVTHATQNGLSTLLLDDDELPPAPAVHTVHAARGAPDGFFFATGSTTAEVPLPWEDVRLVCAAGLREESIVKKTVKEGPSGKERLVRLGITLATGIPLGGGKTKEVQKIVRESEFFLYLDLFVRPPAALGVPAGASAPSAALRGTGDAARYRPGLSDGAALSGGVNAAARLHINAQGFNFGYLGGRKTPGVLGNTRLLLQDIAGAATKALRNKGAEAMLAGQPFNQAGYDTADDYEKEAKWLSALAFR